MGGRGAPSPSSRRRSVWVDTSKRGYTVVISDERSAGESYHFFDQIAAVGQEGKGYFDKKMDRPSWTVISTDPNSMAKVDLHRQHTFGLKSPTLMWYKDGIRKELYIEGVSTEQFLQRSGLAFTYHKGEEAKLFKRMSRIMRSYTVEQRFDRSEVKIERREDPQFQAVFDGAGVISREMLGKLSINSQMPLEKQEKMASELQHAGRVEFTIMTDKGQEKGHAIVSDFPLTNAVGEKVDFILPSDIKNEVKLTDAHTTWVGINFVHGKGTMKMDVQSMANFGPRAGADHAFISPEQHADFVRDDVARFEEAVLAGADPSLKVDRFSTPEEIAASPHNEFALSGGDIRQYPTHTARVFDQKIGSMEFTRDYAHSDRKLRLPVPGVRLYVMPDHVGKMANINISVPRGQVNMDLERGTAWVNSEDWLEVQDSPVANLKGLRDIWGGADNDDALWMIPFKDQAEGADDELKVVAWRSPNEDGEYVVLRPTANSDLPQWKKADGTVIHYIDGNSDYLPTRVDHAQRTYQGVVAEPKGGERVHGYDFADMEAAAIRGAENAGALGSYINPLIAYRAVYGKLPDDLPASTEEIIDAMNKNGGDLKKVKEYAYELSEKMARSGQPIPRYISDRLIFDPNLGKEARNELRGQIRYTEGEHYIDRITQAMRSEINKLQTLRESMVNQAHAPNKLYDRVFNESGSDRYLALGADLNKTFSHTLYKTIRPAQIKALQVKKALELLGDNQALHPDAIKIQAYADGRISNKELKTTTFAHAGVMTALTTKLSGKEKSRLEFTDQDFDQAKWSVWEKLTLYSPVERGKILRAGLVNDLLAGKGGRSMWRYAVRDEVGGMVYHNLSAAVAHELQKTGLGNAMNQALREIGLLNYHADDEGKLKPASPINSEPNDYRSIQFSRLAQLPEDGDTYLHIWKKPGVGEKTLLAQFSDGRLFGEIKSGSVKAGDRIRLKYHKPSSTKKVDLDGVYEPL